MGSGYDVRLDRTCYDISYATESDAVEPGTELFNITIFVEDGITGLFVLGVPDSEIGLKGIGGSAYTIMIINPPSVITFNFSIVAGTSIGETNLLLGSYPDLSVRVTFGTYNPEFQISPLNLTIYSKQ